jgi:hypothetical protein
LDASGTGKVTISNFVYGCQRIKGNAKGMDMVLIHDQLAQLKRKVTELSDRRRAELEASRTSNDGLAKYVQGLRNGLDDLFELHSRLCDRLEC